MIGASLFLYAGFSRDSSGVVADSATGLAWQDDYSDNGGTIKSATWQDALVYCEELSLGGKNDWRLPNMRELKSIVDDTKYNPAINSIFINVSSNNYWSASTVVSDSSITWIVSFNNGDDGWNSKTNENYIRCVRVRDNQENIALSKGLVAYYEFEGNANDSSGNGNDGIEHGGVTYVDGVIGQAGSFDGVNDYIKLNKKNIVGEENFTFSTWIKPSLFDSKWGRSFYTEQNTDEFSKFNIQLKNNEIQLFGRYNSTDRDFRVSIQDNVKNNFYYITIIKQKNILKYYVNGIYINKFLMESEIYDDVDIKKIFIGTQTGSKDTSFKGLIDDLRIYNRALNDNEIKELYKLGTRTDKKP